MLLALSLSSANFSTFHLLPLREPASVSLQRGQVPAGEVKVPESEVAGAQEVAEAVQREVLP